MRFYAVGNMYLSSIQQGIQAAHCVAEMMASENLHRERTLSIIDWAHDHKTIICLNGGNNKSLNDFYDLVRYQSQFPVARFYEDDESLGGLLTCVGIIVPEKIYNADLDDPYLVDRLGSDGFEIARALRSMPLAR